MTELVRLIAARIARTGPMTVADYMADCLLHPEHGYYTTRPPFGAKGDFTTAPEISQMFGEMLGLALAQAWLDRGAPAPFTLAEPGPGRGTLMADILRATKAVPGFHAAMRLYLIEASPALRTEQAQRLPQAAWVDTIGDLPDLPLWMVANEFLDALPIRQFVRAGAGWREKVVRVDDDRLAFALTSAAPLAQLVDRLEDTSDGDLVEYCPALPGIVGTIGEKIAARGGAALFIDYGDWRSLGDTLQAVRAHGSTDPLAEPGLADLTAHVDFEAVALAAAPARYSRLTSQGVFLERLGITARAQSLAGQLSGAALDTHIAAHRRLTHPAEMGNLFKVQGLFPEGQRPPPGLNV